MLPPEWTESPASNQSHSCLTQKMFRRTLFVSSVYQPRRPRASPLPPPASSSSTTAERPVLQQSTNKPLPKQPWQGDWEATFSSNEFRAKDFRLPSNMARIAGFFAKTPPPATPNRRLCPLFPPQPPFSPMNPAQFRSSRLFRQKQIPAGWCNANRVQYESSGKLNRQIEHRGLWDDCDLGCRILI